ncbi:MAG: UV damage endonuclease UvsE [Chloroflexi bacterium]|nr:UV damage endonuclease UvsE [Chloroflexota bacterium]
MLRLGVATRILGHDRLRNAGVHQAEAGTHVSLRLLRVCEVLRYLQAHHIGFYRLPEDLLAAEDSAGVMLAQRAAADMFGEAGALARSAAIRLTVHSALSSALGTAAPDVAARAGQVVGLQAALLDALGVGAESVVVLHVGGASDDRAAAIERFAARFERLAPAVRRRMAVEHDDTRFGLFDVLRLHRITGVPVVFDALHLQLHNPERIGLAEALSLALATWPPGVRPEVHFSTQRTEAHMQPQSRGAPHVLAPRPGQHSDYLNPFEFIALLNAARGLPPFDIMLEAKAADLALLRLRTDLQRYAPELASRVQ